MHKPEFRSPAARWCVLTLLTLPPRLKTPLRVSGKDGSWIGYHPRRQTPLVDALIQLGLVIISQGARNVENHTLLFDSAQYT